MWYLEVQKAAAAKVTAVMAKPMPLAGAELVAAYERGEDPMEVGDCDAFDPWDIFPALYGTYSSEFDDLAIEILTDLTREPGDPQYGLGQRSRRADVPGDALPRRALRVWHEPARLLGDHSVQATPV